MRGRGSSEVSDDIEILDDESAPVHSLDLVETGSNNRWAAVAASALAVSAGLFVVGVGNSPAPLQPPEVIIDEAPAEAEQPLTEREQLEDQYGVAIGDGPELDWQRIGVDTNARYWRWDTGSFRSDNGTTEWRIELGGSSRQVSERPSPHVDNPGYSSARMVGGSLLVPDDPTPDHLLVISDERDDVRLEIPPSGQPSVTSLTKASVWFYGAIIGNQIVINRSIFTEVEVAELAARTQRDLTGVVHVYVGSSQIDLYTNGPGPGPEPILLAESGLSGEEIDELRSIGQPFGDVFTADLTTGESRSVDLLDFEYNNDLLIGLEGELILGWTDQGGVSWLSTTRDGLAWSTERRGVSRWLVNSGSQLFDFNTQGSSISRSVDGETWNLTPVPIPETQRAVAGDVIVLGESWNRYETSGVSIETGSDEYQLSMFDGGERFELRGQSPFGDPLLAGWTFDPQSGATWDRATHDLVFIDPRAGEELLRISGHAVESAVALLNPMDQMALTRWPVDAANPEWLIASPRDFFGAGTLRAEFVSGDKYLLAIITTVDGYELYVADTAQQS